MLVHNKIQILECDNRSAVTSPPTDPSTCLPPKVSSTSKVAYIDTYLFFEVSAGVIVLINSNL